MKNYVMWVKIGAHFQLLGLGTIAREAARALSSLENSIIMALQFSVQIL